MSFHASCGLARRCGRAGVSSFALVAALAMGLAAGPLSAQPMPEIAIADGQGGVTASDAAGLMARVRAQGRLVVIVGLDMGISPEGALAPADLDAQRSAIAAAQGRLLARLGGDPDVVRFATVPYLSMVVTPAELRRLLTLPGVASVAEDVPMRPALSESARMINAPLSWRQGYDGTGQTVVVIDSGVQVNHVAFEDAILAGACYSRSVEGLSRSLCPNGQDSQLGVLAGRACRPVDFAQCYHGTHVAGIAMGDLPRNRGIAPDAGLVSMQVFSEFEGAACSGVGLPSPCILSYTGDLLRALERVIVLHDRDVAPRIAAVNMSLGSGPYAQDCDYINYAVTLAVENLRSRGIATVAASMNDGVYGAIGLPACISSVIGVGATTKDDEVALFSNHAASVSLMAPGAHITAPWYRRARNRVTSFSGTSMAAPHVAGAIALLREAHPEASVDEVERALACTGVPVSRNYLPRPRINVNAARRFLDAPETERLWTFRTDRQVSQWTHHYGNWSREGLAMTVRDDLPGNWYLATSPFCAGNVEVTASIRMTQPRTGGFWPAGVLLSSVVDDDSGTMSGLWFTVHPPSGSALIYEFARLDYVQGFGTLTLVCGQPAAYAVRDDVNALRVVSQDGLHRLFVNGEEVCGHFDRRYGIGHVGVMLSGPGTAGEFGLDVLRLEARSLDALPAGAVEEARRSLPGPGMGAAGMPTLVLGVPPAP